jgi:hypothetical protein
MVSAWVTVLLTAAGLVVGALTARWRIQHEREEQLRDRMISAADDFVTGALQAQVALWEAGGAEERGSSLEARRPEALRLIAEAHARLARVNLLFGLNTAAGEAATDTINDLWSGRHALESIPPSREGVLQASGVALEALNKFTELARNALAEPWPPS